MLDTKYDHKKTEEGKYNIWLGNNYFKCDENSNKKPYTIVLPPPNVTGVLHLGHAWDVTLQDIIIRYKKMEGYDTLWLPGMDHADMEKGTGVVKITPFGAKPVITGLKEGIKTIIHQLFFRKEVNMQC